MKSSTELTNENGRLTVEELVNRDKTFRYMLLSRLQSDCDYYLHYGGRHPKVLWAGDETRQIEFMTKLHESFGAGEKPEWLTMEQIRHYAAEMLGADS